MYTVIGLMSGTSLDGVDAAELKTDGHQIQSFGETFFLPYPDVFQKQLRTLCQRAYDWKTPQFADPEMHLISTQLTTYHVQAVSALIDKIGMNKSGSFPDAIGFHGQTIAHHPQKSLRYSGGEMKLPWTLQIGEPDMLAQKFKCPIIYDFRSQDVAAGGEGAPLVPIYHQALLTHIREKVVHKTEETAFLNVGGVSNITLLAPTGLEETHLIAFDSGPGNARLNDWCQQHFETGFDQDGRFSKQGVCDVALCDQWLSHPYFKRPIPKSLDRQDFKYEGLAQLSSYDGAATLCVFMARAIATSLQMCGRKISHLYLTGGGRHNPTFMTALKQYTNIECLPVEVIDCDGDALEAQAFAFLAARHLAQLPSTFPGTTGIATPLIIGQKISANSPERHKSC